MKFVAMYLPQFHDCPMNSEWWGRGFTEWNNVKTAKPLFDGHRQPRVPRDGYYSLDTTEQIRIQAQQAKDHGIYGFSIYHYWYQGVRPLSKPLDLILANKDIDLNFSLCWANHSWTRSWKNRLGSLDVLIEQTYESNDKDRAKHESFLCQAFSDQRYIRVEGKPLLQIYMPESIPELPRYIESLRSAARRQLGVEIHISAMLTAWRSDWSYLDELDSVTLFQPSLALFSPATFFASDAVGYNRMGIGARLRASPQWLKKIIYLIQDRLPEFHKVFSYEETWERLLQQCDYSLRFNARQVFPMAFVDFDNTPRYQSRARLFEGYSVEKFRHYLTRLVDLTTQNQPNGIIFLNAWNEWGEGMYLEPDVHSGSACLEAVFDVIKKHAQKY